MVYTVTNVKDTTQSVGGSVFWEILLTFGVSLPFFTQGIATALDEPRSSVFITSNISWNQTARLIAAAASAPVLAFVTQKYGRKTGYFCISIVQGAILIPAYIGTHDSFLYLHILAGISSGGVFTVLPAYIREVTSTKMRGFCLTLTMLMTVSGYMLQAVPDSYYGNEVRIYLMLVLVAAQLILFLCLVESPGYLVMVGKNEKAKAAISSVKRVPVEDPLILKEIDSLSDEIARTGVSGKVSLISLYKNKICWDSMKMVFLLYTTMEICGSLIFLDTRMAKTNEDAIMAVVLLGSFLSVLVASFWDRKYIITFGYATMAVAIGVNAVNGQFNIHGSFGLVVSQAADVFLSILHAAYGISWGLPALITVELFNVKVRTPMLAALFTYSQLLRLLHAHTFHHLRIYVGIHTLYYVFAGVNLYAGVYSLFVLPNVRNCNLKQIEKQIKRVPLPA